MKGRESIVIQPGQAFGTGHHGSTRGALRLIEELFQSHRFRRVLDVGTGSGILAIAMRKWGAQEVIAIDIDPVALENAGENARLNHLNKSIRFSAAPVASIRGRFDLIAANILSSVLVPMAAALKQRLRPGGFLVLAGILAREVDTVAAAYAPELKLIRIRAERTWRALLFER
jgi:ribosomal protein L11 methyltransferase